MKILALPLLLAASPAFAQSAAPGYPARVVDRPLTLTGGGFAIEGALALVSVEGLDKGFGMAVGGTYGISDDLQIEAVLLPLSLAPEVDYGDPSATLTYRFSRGSTEVGAQVGITLPAQTNTQLSFGLPVLMHLGDLRIDTGFGLNLLFVERFNGNDVVSIPTVPFGLTGQLTDRVVAGVVSGISLPEFDFDNTIIPLFVYGAYTLGGGTAPQADISVVFGFPGFLTPAANNKSTLFELWTLGVGFTLYFFG